MNKILIILSLVLLASCSPKEVPPSDLVERQGIQYEVNSQTPFTGIVVDYYENGQLSSKGNYKDGKKDGLWEYFDENGQLRFKSNYKDGKEDGLQESYYENGQLWTKVNGKDGKEDGLYEKYHENGQLRIKGNLKDGKLDGLTERYDENGQLKDKICFKNGKEVDMSYCQYLPCGFIRI
jgi:antitoxin component YwqK of YwqJK toxin-antitoxin module|tara:strand:+ start:144 stop:680 length:537 start_codon:yes stop_codon:yes gene_type:complete